MPYNFEKFTQTGGRFAAKASIRSNGSLGLSHGAILRYKLSEGDWYAVLFYDKEQRVIGIKLTRDKMAEGASRLIVRPNKTGGEDTSYSSSLSAKSFLDFYGISHGKSQSYQVDYDKENEMIIMDLKTGSESEDEDSS